MLDSAIQVSYTITFSMKMLFQVTVLSTEILLRSYLRYVDG